MMSEGGGFSPEFREPSLGPAAEQELADVIALFADLLDRTARDRSPETEALLDQLAERKDQLADELATAPDEAALGEVWSQIHQLRLDVAAARREYQEVRP